MNVARETKKAPSVLGALERGAARIRTGDGGFAIRCLSRLATAPIGGGIVKIPPLAGETALPKLLATPFDSKVRQFAAGGQVRIGAES